MTQTPTTAHRSAASVAATAQPDLVVLSHLRWDWVWQRPQHLISRLARGRRTWFVEEPVRADVDRPRLRRQDAGPVRRVWLEVPRSAPGEEFAAPGCEVYADLLAGALDAGARTDVWMYTPTALDLARTLRPRVLAYDVMDDLAAFADGGDHLRRAQHRALCEADVVFTGGRSLHRAAVEVRGADGVHLYPSGVETGHYATSRALRRPRPRPAAGYVGVLDERLDQALVADLAARLPDWDIHLVGPVAKIDPAGLPQAPNLHYPGMQPYERLPEVMAGFDVALMPFALNEATRSISPTKTLEYLAAGLPVVSTRVPDVVADWGSVVRLADDGAAFARACLQVCGDSLAERDARVAPLRRRHEWDAIAAEMAGHLAAAARARTALAGGVR
ncbi:MAG TPA: glycosyltransferase [Pilimelia sp.]|nr:glycosyltransferase [Pilimelia sp.]